MALSVVVTNAATGDLVCTTQAARDWTVAELGDAIAGERKRERERERESERGRERGRVSEREREGERERESVFERDRDGTGTAHMFVHVLTGVSYAHQLAEPWQADPRPMHQA